MHLNILPADPVPPGLWPFYEVCSAMPVLQADQVSAGTLTGS